MCVCVCVCIDRTCHASYSFWPIKATNTRKDKNRFTGGGNFAQAGGQLVTGGTLKFHVNRTQFHDQMRDALKLVRSKKSSFLLSYLQVVSLAWDVGGDLLADGEADEDALPARRVRLLRLLDHRLYHDSPKSSLFYKIFSITQGITDTLKNGCQNRARNGRVRSTFLEPTSFH